MNVDRLREEQITERVAEVLARTLPDISPIDAAGADTCHAAVWPNDWGAGELAAYRQAAGKVMAMLKPLLGGVGGVAPRDREAPFFVRAETAAADIAAWLKPRRYTEAIERFDRAGNLMFCLRMSHAGSFAPAGLVVTVRPERIAEVRQMVMAGLQ